ncbi:tigA [Candida pseudojiufengensis]|uniref:tigA n=1 Tax=Candida pseudojiufengensis TaxID=497109 RepID=UPI002224C054|nr:tigA [Candida pseudojiufengensis]KAI5959622.1 tigA [Candida pseudojiufengensis]
MRLSSILIFLINLISLTIAAYSSSKIIQANDQNFNQLIKTPGKFTFVDFYADWCRHCKKLSPIIDELSILFQDYPQIQILKINGDKDGKKLSKKYVEIGYPTLLFFDDTGKHTEFQGIRDLETFSKFIQLLSGIRLGDKVNEDLDIENSSNDNDNVSHKQQILQTEEENNEEDSHIIELTADSFKKTIETNPNIVVLFSSEYCNACQDFEHLYKQLTIETFGKDFENLKFAEIIVDDEESQKIVSSYGLKNLPSLLFFKNGDINKPIIYNGDVRKFDRIVNSINLFYGLSREIDGTLKKDAGVLSDISSSITEYIKNGETKIDEIYAKLDKISDNNKSSEFYKLILESLNYGTKFLNLEFNRIQFILNEDFEKLDSLTIDLLNLKLNILKSLKF